MDLAQLFNHYGSDKDRNGYAQLYSVLLSRRRNDVSIFLEIGIGTMLPGVCSSMQGYALDGYAPGGSLRAWRDWFPKAQIWGCDVQPDTQFSEHRISTRLCDSTDADAVRKTFGSGSEPPSIDVIVDDGSHFDQHQLATLRNFWPLLCDDGVYVVEDIHPGSQLSVEPRLVGEIVGHDVPYFFVGVKNNLCVLQKTTLDTRRVGY
jgi:hypothetical protein